MRSLIQRLEAMGLEVHITELDVQIDAAVARGLATQGNVLQKQADTYADVVRLCLTEPKCSDITLWGIADHLSSVLSWAPQDRPLVFDTAYEKKPAYDAVKRVMQEALAAR